MFGCYPWVLLYDKAELFLLQTFFFILSPSIHSSFPYAPNHDNDNLHPPSLCQLHTHMLYSQELIGSARWYNPYSIRFRGREQEGKCFYTFSNLIYSTEVRGENKEEERQNTPFDALNLTPSNFEVDKNGVSETFMFLQKSNKTIRK